MASWYGAPYHNRRGSNGEVYDMNAMTAAHLTLPLGSVVRITNLKTEHSAVVRITDRGPFVPGRIVDLSLAAAKALDVYLPGTAKVRLEVLQSPAPLDTGGRWAVQIGSFAEKKVAAEFAEHLQKRYQTAQVLKFESPAGGWWVRARVLGDDRQRASTLAARRRPRRERYSWCGSTERLCETLVRGSGMVTGRDIKSYLHIDLPGDRNPRQEETHRWRTVYSAALFEAKYHPRRFMKMNTHLPLKT